MICAVTLHSPISLIRKLFSILYPPRCLCCGKLLPGESPLCPACSETWGGERKKAASPRADGVPYLAPYTKSRSVTRRSFCCVQKIQTSADFIYFLQESLQSSLSHAASQRILSPACHAPLGRSQYRCRPVEPACTRTCKNRRLPIYRYLKAPA